MGGRGAFSRTHGGIAAQSGGAGSLYISKLKETRADIRKLFIDELGFKELYGTNEVPTAQLAALAIQLKKSERQVHTLRDSKAYLTVTHKAGVKGAAAQMKDGSSIMFVNPSYHSNVGFSRRVLKSEQKSGFKTRTDNKITNDFSYTARHEYGHLTQYHITSKSGKNSIQIRSEVRNIARSKHGARSKNPSQYGKKNSKEYFAESFASMTGGKPNAHGKALNEWLKRNKFKKG